MATVSTNFGPSTSRPGNIPANLKKWGGGVVKDVSKEQQKSSTFITAKKKPTRQVFVLVRASLNFALGENTPL